MPLTCPKRTNRDARALSKRGSFAGGWLPRRKKLVLAALIPYLLMPFDLVPDFIPVAGYLDDAVIVAFALRYVLRGSGPDLISAHWPGPPASLDLVLRLAGQARGLAPHSWRRAAPTNRRCASGYPVCHEHALAGERPRR